MNKNEIIKESYNNGFEDELNKLSSKYDISSKLVRSFGVPLKKSMSEKKKGPKAIIENMKKFKRMNKEKGA